MKKRILTLGLCLVAVLSVLSATPAQANGPFDAAVIFSDYDGQGYRSTVTINRADDALGGYCDGAGYTRFLVDQPRPDGRKWEGYDWPGNISSIYISGQNGCNAIEITSFKRSGVPRQTWTCSQCAGTIVNFGFPFNDGTRKLRFYRG